MKLKAVQTIIAIAASLLISYGFYNYSYGGKNLLVGIGTFVLLSSTLVFAFGADLGRPRTTTNVRIVAGVFSFVAVASNLIFSFFSFAVPPYVIVNGLLLLAYFLTGYSIYRAGQ